MPAPVFVPHSSSRPTTLLYRRPLSAHDALERHPQYDEAYALHADAIESYHSYHDLQDDIVRQGLDELAFAREVDDAAERIAGISIVTPTFNHKDVVVKDETQQLTRAYKVRGAANFILSHEVAAHHAGVITASAGNHGQAVALVAAKIGAKSTIVVPRHTPQIKIDGIKEQGGVVHEHGNSYEEATAMAIKISAEQKGLYVPAFNHRDIMAGQATIGKELLEAGYFGKGEPTDLVVPTGGGGLLAGLVKYLFVRAPNVTVYGAGVNGASALENTLYDGNPYGAKINTFADGIAVGRLGTETWPIINEYAARLALTVNEDTLRRTVGELLGIERQVEGAGAVGLAAALEHSASLGRNVITIATGGNIDPSAQESCRQNIDIIERS